MYKLTQFSTVIRVSDGGVIPLPANEAEGFKYLEWLAEGNTPEPADAVENPRIAEIKSELIALDIKRIRPLAEGDVDYLATLNAQAIALRSELTSLTGQVGVAKTASDASTEEASADSIDASADKAAIISKYS